MSVMGCFWLEVDTLRRSRIQYITIPFFRGKLFQLELPSSFFKIVNAVANMRNCAPERRLDRFGSRARPSGNAGRCHPSADGDPTGDSREGNRRRKGSQPMGKNCQRMADASPSVDWRLVNGWLAHRQPLANPCGLERFQARSGAVPKPNPSGFPSIPSAQLHM